MVPAATTGLLRSTLLKPRRTSTSMKSGIALKQTTVANSTSCVPSRINKAYHLSKGLLNKTGSAIAVLPVLFSGPKKKPNIISTWAGAVKSAVISRIRLGSIST